MTDPFPFPVSDGKPRSRFINRSSHVTVFPRPRGYTNPPRRLLYADTWRHDLITATDKLSIQDRHKGQRVFVCGTSPHITELDKRLLDGQVVIGINEWWQFAPCNYWICGDSSWRAWEKWGKAIPAIEAIRFLHIDTGLRSIPRDAAHYWFSTKSTMPEFNTEWNGTLYQVKSSAIAAIHLAIIMGAAEVVLWGVDFIGKGRFNGTECEQGDWENRLDDVTAAISRLNQHISMVKTNPDSPLDFPMFDPLSLPPQPPRLAVSRPRSTDTITGRHHGKRFFLGGTSPNLENLDHNQLKTGLVIGINNFPKAIPDASDYWITCDTHRIDERMPGMDRLPVEKFMATDTGKAGKRPEHWFSRPPNTQVGLYMQPQGDYPIPTEWRGYLQHVWSSATAAANLAAIMGAGEIVLWGVDLIGDTLSGGRMMPWEQFAPAVSEFFHRLPCPVYKTNPDSPLELPLWPELT